MWLGVHVMATATSLTGGSRFKLMKAVFFMRCVSDLNAISDGHQSNDPAGTRGSITLSALGQ